MKKRSVLSVFLMIVLFLQFLLPAAGASAEAAPSVSSSAYCEFIAQKTIPVYRDAACKTRGTSSPAKSYNAYADPGDVCYILKMGSTLLISYPTPSGRKQGYVRRSDVMKEAPKSHIVSAGKQTTCKTPGGAGYGYTEAGDSVWICGTYGSSYLLMYEAKSGSRRYKLGFMTISNYKKIVPAPAPKKETKHLQGVPNFKQTDSRWAGLTIRSKTIRDVGCLITSMAMSESFRLRKTVTPKDILSTFNFSGNELVWPGRYKTWIATGTGSASLKKIYDTIKAGKPCIAGAYKGNSNWHWVLIYGYTNADPNNLKTGNFEINDPNSGSRTSLDQFIADRPYGFRVASY